jgi:hypothetical protein
MVAMASLRSPPERTMAAWPSTAIMVDGRDRRHPRIGSARFVS